MIKKFFFIFFLILIFYSCKTKPEIKPDIKNSSSQNKVEIIEKKVIEDNSEKIELPKQYYAIEINVINGNSQVIINNENKGISPVKLELEKGVVDIVLSRKDYQDQICRLEINNNSKFHFRHQKIKFLLSKLGFLNAGNSPNRLFFLLTINIFCYRF